MNKSLPKIIKRRSIKAATEIHNISTPIIQNTFKTINHLPKRRNTINNPTDVNSSKRFLNTMYFSKDLIRRNDMKRKTFVLKSKIDITCENIDNDCKKLFRQILTQTSNVDEEEDEDSFDNFKTDVKNLNEEIDKKGFFKVYRSKYKPTILQKQFISSKPDNIFYKNQIIDNMPPEYVYKFRKELNQKFKMNLPFYSTLKKKERKIDNQRSNIIKKFNQNILYEKNLADKLNVKVNKSVVEYLKI